MIYDIVDATEMIDSFHDVIHIDCFVCDADCICFLDIPCLVVSQFATLDMIGIISQIYLGTMINVAFELHFLLFSERNE